MEIILVGCAFVLMGMFFGIATTIMAISYSHKVKRCTMRTEAMIVKVIMKRHHTSSGNKRLWHPVYRCTLNGETVEVSNSLGGPKSSYVVGTAAVLRINPDNVSDFYAEDGKLENLVRSFIITTIACVVVGIIAAVIGGIYG